VTLVNAESVGVHHHYQESFRAGLPLPACIELPWKLSNNPADISAADSFASDNRIKAWLLRFESTTLDV